MVLTLEGHLVLSFTSFIQPCLSNSSRRPFMDVHFYIGIFDLSLTNNYSSYQYILITIIPSYTMIVYSNILSRQIEGELNLSICQNLWVMGFLSSWFFKFLVFTTYSKTTHQPYLKSIDKFESLDSSRIDCSF